MTHNHTHKFLSPLFGLALSTAALLTPAATHAGLIMEQTMEGSEAPSQTTMRIQNGMIRTDISEELSTIADTKAGEVMTIIHPAKMVSVISQPKGEAAPKIPNLPTPKYKVLGMTEKVNGYECNVVSMEMGEMKSTFWVAKSYPDYDKIKAEMATIKPASGAPETPKELDGLILKTSTVGPKYLGIVTIKSVKIEEIPADVFKAPAGYTVSRQ